ncbi:MAG: hypothetical protein LM567_02210 [Desulfurococcaceae archaeon]|jgi:hypothetical protein|nr:hypothetical protein [Desulfurococcaceae archaeon]
MIASSDAHYYEEIYFDEFYRVLVLSEKDNFIVSVDVYVKKASFESPKETCIDNICLLLKEVKDASRTLLGVINILVVAIKVRENPVEVISVKWILNHKPSREEIEYIYKKSWEIVNTL